MPNPLVSIIVPVYNLAPYLPACINSLLEQTYAPLEIIFINDSSTDSSLEILKEYQRQYPHFKIITQPNSGPGPARNTGLDEASGEYVLFVDGDDWIAADTVAICIETAIGELADIVCFGFRKVTKRDGREFELQRFEYEPACYLDSDYVAGALSENSHNRAKLNTAVWGKLYSLSLLNNHQIRFRQAIFEDSPFTLEAVFHASRIRCVKDALYNYFIRESSTTEQSITSGILSAAKISGFYTSDEMIKDFLVSKKVFDKYDSLYYAFHNSRVLMYGGYFEVYSRQQSKASSSWPLFISALRGHWHTITLQRKGLYRAYRKRTVALYAGAMISRFSLKAAHLFFTWYEKTMAPQ
ncbi:glycosyltransferase family 2 protein [Chitinophaga polysaccharea]|uniref:glycosyltransferase family 2 protein n=1 Tax=Chitinophaga polysaccharea TaxID=1293035 RepID=UPI0011588AB3|nr:glycosyltransferase [Chitinophaga polysaccharea]